MQLKLHMTMPGRRQHDRARKQPSELDSQAGGRGDVLLCLEAAGEPAIDVRNHHAGVEINPLNRAIVDQDGKGVFRARASVAVDAANSELASVWFDEGSVDANAGRGVKVGLLEIIVSAGHVELRRDRVF